jgi:hypothetical protein
VNTTLLTPTDLLAAQSALDGRTFNLSGRIVVTENAYVEVPIQGVPVRIAIDDPQLRDRLLDTVPCHLGGGHMYADQVELTVSLTATASGRASISRVISGELIRDGRRYII